MGRENGVNKGNLWGCSEDCKNENLANDLDIKLLSLEWYPMD